MANKAAKSKSEMSLNNLLSLYVIGGLVLAVAVGYLVIRPVYIAAEDTKTEVRGVERDIMVLEQLEEDTDTLRRNYEEVRDERDQIISLLPSENREEDLLALLNQLAGRSGVLFSNFRPDGGAVTDDTQVYRTYTTRVTVSGAHENVINFMEEVENSSRFMKFSSISAHGGSNFGVDNPQIGLNLILNAYYRSGTAGQGTTGEGTEDEVE